MFKVVDTHDANRIVQTFDEHSAAMLAAERFNAGWHPQRFLVWPLAPGDSLRADHIRESRA